MSSTRQVMQVHLLQSSFSLGDADLSAALYHPLLTPEVSPAKSRDAVPHPQQEALRCKPQTIHTVPPLILLAGIDNVLFHKPNETRPLLWKKKSCLDNHTDVLGIKVCFICLKVTEN